MEVKKWYEYTDEEVRNLENNRLAWVDTVNDLTDKIYDAKMKINNPEIFPRTKTHQRNLERLLESKKDALTHIEDCEKHLKPIWHARLI